jgi:SAM-dependent methyltransferase
VGTDINEYAVQHCNELGLEARLMISNRLPFSGNQFDSALLDNVIEHIQDPSPLLLEIRRILVEGGSLLVGVPGISGWNADSDHKVMYDESKLINLMTTVGFAHLETFYSTIIRSHFLSRYLRPYCIYCLFAKK